MRNSPYTPQELAEKVLNNPHTELNQEMCWWLAVALQQKIDEVEKIKAELQKLIDEE